MTLDDDGIPGWLTGAVVGAVSTGLFLLITTPWAENKHTEIVRASNQYVMSKQTGLRSMYQTWLDLDRQRKASTDPAPLMAQQRSIFLQMQQQADTIDPKYLPPDIAQFIAQEKLR